MGIGAASPHLSSDPYCFHDLFGRGAFLQGRLCMPTDAIRTLGDVSYCYGNQLLGLRGECPLGEHTLTESLEGFSRFWSQVLTLFYQFLGRWWVNLFLFGHDLKTPWVTYPPSRQLHQQLALWEVLRCPGSAICVGSSILLTKPYSRSSTQTFGLSASLEAKTMNRWQIDAGRFVRVLDRGA